MPSSMRWTPARVRCCSRARIQSVDSRTSARPQWVEAACMSAPRTVSCMRLDWAYRSRRTAFFAALYLPTLVAQQNSVSIFDGQTLKGWDSISKLELPEIRWAMEGYQADIDADQKYTGQIYEERGRGFLPLRGQSVSIEKGAKPVVLA